MNIVGLWDVNIEETELIIIKKEANMKRLAVLSLLLIFVLEGCQSLSIGDKTAQARESDFM